MGTFSRDPVVRKTHHITKQPLIKTARSEDLVVVLQITLKMESWLIKYSKDKKKTPNEARTSRIFVPAGTSVGFLSRYC